MTKTEPATNGNGNGARPAQRPIPFDLETEASVLGSMMLTHDARSYALDYPLHGVDFYKPAHALIFTTIEQLNARPGVLDATVVANELANADRLDFVGGKRALLEMEGVARTYVVREHVKTIGDLAAFRRAIGYGRDVSEAGYARDLEKLIDIMRGGPDRIVGDLDAGLEFDPPKDVLTITPRKEIAPRSWAVPELFVPGDRLIVTGAEGGGKTTWLRQFAVQCAAGIHPMRLDDMTQLRVIHFDLQDSEDQSDLEYDWILGKSNARARIAPGALLVQHRRQGFDILNRGDAKWFEKLIAPRGQRPADLVIVGPLYKTFRAHEGKSKHDPSLAEEVTARYDEILGRTGAAIMFEAHAPQGVANDRANFRPEGAAQWLRWPEFGFAFRPIKPNADRGETESRGVHVGRFRGDRDRHRLWPTMLFYGKGEQWPFMPPADQVL